MSITQTRDNHPAIMIKPSILARSGVYLYTHDEMIKRGFTPPVRKEIYKEYRPAAVLIRNKDKFAFTAMTVEHTDDEISAANFRDQASGVIGDSIEVTTLDDGEVALRGNIAFYTQDAVDYFNAGNKETSADYRSKVVLSKNPLYDLELVDIISVNAVVITERGRGGENVRVRDSLPSAQKKTGGLKMGYNVLGFLGIGRTKDKADFKLSQVVMTGVKQVHTVDAKKLDELVGGVMRHITVLSESKDREILIGAVQDSFKHPVEVIAKEKEVSALIDKFYSRCVDADEKALKETMDSVESEDKEKAKKTDTKDGEETPEEKAKREKEEKDEKDGAKTKDTARLIDEAFAKFRDEMKRTLDGIPGVVDAAVAKSLSLGAGAGGKTDGDTRTIDSTSIDNGDAAFLLDGIFGK
jgi:hypothetical protein